jgi:glycosyltransferase involved in cell wall biosynthesis
LQRAALLHLVNGLVDSSVTRLILDLVKRLGKERYEFHIGSLSYVDDGMEAEFQRAGAKVVNFGMTGRLDLRVIPQLVSYIDTNNIRLVHTHVLRPDFVGGVAARLSRDPLLFSTKHNIGYIRGQSGWILRNLIYWPLMYLPDQVVTVTEDLVVTYAGRLVSGKGLDCILAAARQLLARQPDCYFLIVGDGPLREVLQRRAQELGVASHVIFTGFRVDIPEILAATDVFVLPSLSEGMPKSLLEAMGAAKPVVATPVGGVLELVEHDVTGLTVPPRDPTALADAIWSILGNPSRREELGRQARAYARRNFSIERMVSAYDSLYQECFGRRMIM